MMELINIALDYIIEQYNCLNREEKLFIPPEEGVDELLNSGTNKVIGTAITCVSDEPVFVVLPEKTGVVLV